MNDMEWRPIVGWEGYYEVSDHGVVRGVDRWIHHPINGPTFRRGIRLYVAVSPKGYHNVALCRDSQKVTRPVHRLVLEAFVGPRPEGMECLHRDGDPSNNHVANLRWGTPSENTYDRVRHGTHFSARKTHCTTCERPYDAINTYVTPSGARGCRACRNRRTREYRQRQKEAKAS